MKLYFRVLSFVVALAFASSIALAHGNQKHVVGTVEKVTADTVTVKTPDGKSVDVKLIAATTYVSLGADKVSKPGKLSDLHVGDRVVIHATPKGETLEATEVRFSAAAVATGSK